MSFPSYPDYKSSGVEWLGDIPSHWQLAPLWTLFHREKRTGFPEEVLLSIYRDYGVIPKSSRDDNHNKPSDDLDAYQLVNFGDLAINKMKAWQGSVAISGCRGIVSPAYHVYAKRHDMCDRYLHHLFRSQEYIAGYLSNSKGIRVNQWDLEPQQHSRMPVLLPPPEEQNIVAYYLDHETAHIDALIEEQQRLIELLKEKRQAVISHAVTKGLDPNVPMKDSGVEWLGDVPEHWRVNVKLQSFAESSKNSFVNGPFGSDLLSEELTDVGVPVIYIRDIKVNGYRRKSTVFVTEGKALDLDACRTSSGDVLVAKVGDPPGESCVYPDAEEKAIITQDVIRIRVEKSSTNPNYLSLLLNSDYGRKTIEDISVESTRKRISLGDFKSSRFLKPPKEEQDAIASYLKGTIHSLDALMKESSLAIKLIKERRSALISAAVTGKIDVRNWQPGQFSSADTGDDYAMAAEPTAEYR